MADNKMHRQSRRLKQSSHSDVPLSEETMFSSELEFAHIDLNLCFENLPVDMEEFNQQYVYNKMLGTLVAQSADMKSSCSNVDRGPKLNLNDPSLQQSYEDKSFDTQQFQSYAIDETIICDQSSLLSNSCDLINPGTANKNNLQLDLSSIQELPQEEISTPVIISMLLEETESKSNEVRYKFYSN